jgi:GNAT superfamily N-acetyltransferase
MTTRPIGVTTVAGDTAIDNAIARLVLAFDTDPIACWLYEEPHQYLGHMPRLFHALAASALDAGTAERTSDGRGVAIWLPPGVHGDDRPVEAVVADSLAEDKQAEFGKLLEGTEHYRPAEPHWYLSLIGVDASRRSTGGGARLIERRCDRERRPAYLWSSNPRNLSFYERHGFEIVGMIQKGSSPPIFPMLRRAC